MRTLAWWLIASRICEVPAATSPQSFARLHGSPCDVSSAHKQPARWPLLTFDRTQKSARPVALVNLLSYLIAVALQGLTMTDSASHSEPPEAPPHQRRLPNRQPDVLAEGAGSTAAATNVAATPPTHSSHTAATAPSNPSAGAPSSSGLQQAVAAQEARLKELLLELAKKNMSGSWGSQKRASKNSRWAFFVPSSEAEIEGLPALDRRKLESETGIRDKCEAISCWLCHLEASLVQSIRISLGPVCMPRLRKKWMRWSY